MGKCIVSISNVASCWIYEYIGIMLGARPILHISRIKVNPIHALRDYFYKIGFKTIVPLSPIRQTVFSSGIPTKHFHRILSFLCALHALPIWTLLVLIILTKWIILLMQFSTPPPPRGTYRFSGLKYCPQENFVRNGAEKDPRRPRGVRAPWVRWPQKVNYPKFFC
jgi:hypothetical protein